MTWLTSAWSWLRAHPWATAGALAALVLVLLGVVWVLLGRLEAARQAWRGAERERERAAAERDRAEDTADELADAWAEDVEAREEIEAERRRRRRQSEETHREEVSQLRRLRDATADELARWVDGLRPGRAHP